MALELQAAGTNFGLLPKLGQCPWQVIRCLCRELSTEGLDGHFHSLTTGHSWHPDCEYEVRLQIATGE
jgi:hypothetical protein